MTHNWKVTHKGIELGEVKAISKKGAEHAAYAKFGIRPTRVSQVHVSKIVAVDPARPGSEAMVMAEVVDGKVTNVMQVPS